MNLTQKNIRPPPHTVIISVSHFVRKDKQLFYVFPSIIHKPFFSFLSFRYPYFIMRAILAAIHHDMHRSRGNQTNAAGDQRGHRKFSKHTQKFHAEIVTEEKSYSYFPILMAKMLKERCLLHGSFSQSTDDNLFDPKQIAATIGMKVAHPTEELLKGQSRLSKPVPSRNLNEISSE